MENRIRKIRKEKGIAGTTVADILGITPQYYYEIERGKKRLSANMATELAAYFGVKIDYLLGQIEENEQTNSSVSANTINSNYSIDELRILDEMKKFPVFFNDLASDPSKLKKVIKMWEFIKQDIENDDDEEPEE